MAFYYYKQEPKIYGVFDFPSPDFATMFSDRTSTLKPIGGFAYFFHWLRTGPAFAVKEKLPREELVRSVLSRIRSDYRWAKSKEWEIQIRLANHIDDDVGLSILLCMKPSAASEQGWVMLEQVVLKRSGKTFALWRYADDEE